MWILPAGFWLPGDATVREVGSVHGYENLEVWRVSRRLSLTTLRSVRGLRHPETFALVDQLRRAVVSVETNVVEGYSLQTTALFRRHLRIALGSAAEVKCLLQLIVELGYLDPTTGRELLALADRTVGLLYGLLRKLTGRTSRG